MKGLTRRQQKFLEELPRTNSIAQAARNAGYSSKFAGQAGYLALKSIRRKAPELLEEMEASLTELIEKHIKPGLEAKKTVYIRYRGKITQQFDEPDNMARLEVLKLVLRLHGVYEK